jgi:hypothetical protein
LKIILHVEQPHALWRERERERERKRERERERGREEGRKRANSYVTVSVSENDLFAYLLLVYWLSLHSMIQHVSLHLS